MGVPAIKQQLSEQDPTRTSNVSTSNANSKWRLTNYDNSFIDYMSAAFSYIQKYANATAPPGTEISDVVRMPAPKYDIGSAYWNFSAANSKLAFAGANVVNDKAGKVFDAINDIRTHLSEFDQYVVSLQGKPLKQSEVDMFFADFNSCAKDAYHAESNLVYEAREDLGLN